MRNPLALILCLIFLIPACTQASETPPTDTPTQPPADTISPSPRSPTSPTDTPQISGPSYPIQIKISTTSDWSDVYLVSGGIWHDMVIVSASDAATNASFAGDLFSISQSLSDAEAGGSVELVAEGLVNGLDSGNPLIFEIERGHLGTTLVEVSRYQDGTPSIVADFTWEGIKAYAPNTQVFEVSPQPFLGSSPNEYVVIAQLNFWYYGPGKYGGFENWDGSRNTTLIPLLGETYAAADPEVVYQQIEWAVDYGVDAFSIEWTTPRGIGCCGSMEDTLDDVFLKSPNLHKIRWAIFYDFILRIAQTKEMGLEMSYVPNFDQPIIYNTFVEDFVHFAEKYFGHPQYLTIDGRPVIYIWATNAYVGNFSGAMQEARQRVAELGYDVFIVGDEVCYGCFRPAHAALFDGSSTFTFLMPGIDFNTLDDVGDAAAVVDSTFQWWKNKIAGLQVTGREDMVNFQPAWAPQYDERLVEGREENPIYVPATSIDQVIEMATVARKHAEPVGSQDMQLIWVNTWNCWAETTTVEPTANLDPKYPAGNYHFDMLEVIRDVFGEETYYTSPIQ